MFVFFNFPKSHSGIFRVIILMFSVFLFSCEKENAGSSASATILEIPESQTSWNISQSGETVSIQLHSDGRWSVELDDQLSSWISITPLTGGAGDSVISLTIGENWNKEERNGVVTIRSGELYQTVSVIQEGNSQYLVPEGENTDDMPVDKW